MRETLKDASYRIIGFLEIDGSGNQILKDACYKILGTYNKSGNVSKDVTGRIIGYGNILPILLAKK